MKIIISKLKAYVKWFQYHPEKEYFHFPVTIWSTEVECLNAASFIPICRVTCRCAHIRTHMEFNERPYNNGQVMITIPIL